MPFGASNGRIPTAMLSHGWLGMWMVGKMWMVGDVDVDGW